MYFQWKYSHLQTPHEETTNYEINDNPQGAFLGRTPKRDTRKLGKSWLDRKAQQGDQLLILSRF